MSFQRQQVVLEVDDDVRAELLWIGCSRTESARRVEHVKMLLDYYCQPVGSDDYLVTEYLSEEGVLVYTLRYWRWPRCAIPCSIK